MITEKQLAANRRNAQRSTGPKTEEGKKIAAGQRISTVEDNLFALGHRAKSDEIETEDPEIHAALTAAKVFKEESRQRINRSLQKNLAALQALQAARHAKREAEMKEAKKLLQLREMKGLPYGPAEISKDGFVFSTAEIRA
jgi:hypothetical protein